MGCITGIGRVVLIILNCLILVISLVLMAVGVVLKFFPSKLLEIVLGVVDAALDQQTKEDFNIPDVKDIHDLPFIGEIGIAFIVFGAVLFFLSFLACCGACYRWRPLLIMFAVVMILLVICQGVVGGLYLTEDSVLHETIQNTVGDKVKDEFQADGDDVFSFAINIMQYLLGCCGIRGWEDFSGSKPPTCCKKEIIDGDSNDPAVRLQQEQCTSEPPTAPDSSYNPEGCYSLLQEKIQSELTLSAIILAAILLLQVLEVIFACLIVKDVNEENTKISPQ